MSGQAPSPRSIESLRRRLRRVSVLGMVPRRAVEAAVEDWLADHARDLERRCDDMHSGRTAPPIRDTPENRASHMWRYFDQAEVVRRLIKAVAK